MAHWYLCGLCLDQSIHWRFRAEDRKGFLGILNSSTRTVGVVWDTFLGWVSAFFENVLVFQSHLKLQDQDGDELEEDFC